MKVLPMNMYSHPDTSSVTMSAKDLRELLLESEGYIIACGSIYDIKSKHLGVGVHKVTLKRREYK